ncbi:MAG: M48 family metallopeptidase [Phycisphaerales bacterium]|nr:M48 family metallopeptidase [Phycisphaerales bacterium]
MLDNSGQVMNFFEHQDAAKKNTRRFLLLYGIAVLLICGSVGLVAGAAGYLGADLPKGRLGIGVGLGALGTVVTGLLILGASAHRISQLRGGGSVVALSLGGKPINPSTKDPDERRVLNVVEEMSIASGVPMPQVFLMPDENGINAFAAGYTPGDAVIGVTRGCMMGLTRDELQGVMAHEFSHILNGDMRLNIRMIGVLSGILLLSTVGHILLNAAPRTGRGKNGAGNAAMLFVLAFAMLMIGWIGSVMASVIQASISRQREFLADASAVQFTRNPEGIGNALRRIGGNARRARIRHPRAPEAGHMFFGAPVGSSSMSSTLATHPPLAERIRRINPSWDGTMLPPLHPETMVEKAPESHRDRLERTMRRTLEQPGLGGLNELLPMLALSGVMTQQHIEHARSLLEAIPASLRQAAQNVYTGRAVLYAMLLDRNDKSLRDAQLHHLETHADPEIARQTRELMPDAVALRRELRLPLLDMTLGALAQLSEPQHTKLRANVDALIRMDQSIDLFEWVTMNTLKRHLDERFGLARPIPVQYYNLKSLSREVSVLLSALAYAGAEDRYQAGEALLVGESAVQGVGVELLDDEIADMRALDSVLKTLAQCSVRVKKQLLTACALVVGADKTITTNEAELLRAVADALGVPTPPLLPGQRLV